MKKFKTSKKHIQGFIAGMIVTLIVIGGVYFSINPKLLFGSMISFTSVNGDNFKKEVLEADRPVLILFHNASSGPSRRIRPYIEDFGKDYQEYIKTVFINVDEDPKDAVEYNIVSVPMIALFDEGKLVVMRTSITDVKDLRDWVYKQPIRWEYHPAPNTPQNKDITLYHMFPDVMTRSCGDDNDSYSCYGELFLMASSNHKENIYNCNGQSLVGSNKQLLYALMGNTYGGSDYRAFKLPDLSNKVPVEGYNYYINDNGAYPYYEGLPLLKKNSIGYFAYGNLYNRDYYVSEIILAKTTNEDKYKNIILPCDGRELKVEEYPALFSLIDKNYGGDGKETFKLPDLTDVQVPITGAKYYIVVNGYYPY